MSRRLFATYVPDEGGNRLGGSNTEVRIYDGPTETGAVASTIYADDTNAATITQPLKPNAGVQTTLPGGANNGDTVLGVGDTSGFQIGDHVPINDGATQIFRTITAINVGGLTMTVSPSITSGPFSGNATIGNSMMKGWIHAWLDDVKDYTVEVKNVATGKIGPRHFLPLRAPNSNPCARAYHSAAQSATTGVHLALALDSERFDTDTIHDLVTNNSRLTCKTAGKYVISGAVEFAGNATGYRQLSIKLNGTTFIGNTRAPVPDATAFPLAVATIFQLAVNDYVELMALQNSGGGLNVNSTAQISPEFAMAKVSD